MNTFDAAYNFGVKEETVREWCRRKYIRGVKIDPQTGEYIIPDSAKRPYTQKGSPKGDAIYTSIVKAVMNEMDVCAELYNMDPAEFHGYINELISVGIIDTYNASDTGIRYYRQTLKSSEFSKLPKNKVSKFLLGLKPSNVNVNIGLNVN